MRDDDDSGSSSTQRGDWRFLVDENLKPAIATELEHHAIVAESVVGELFEGADDFEDILPYCRETDTILVTNNVRNFNPTDLASDEHAGIVIVHDKDRPATEIATELRRIASAYQHRGEFRGFESADDWGVD